MNGQLSSTVALGFNIIFITLPNDQGIKVDQTGVTVDKAGIKTSYHGDNQITLGR